MWWTSRILQLCVISGGDASGPACERRTWVTRRASVATPTWQ
eukprot:gene39116-52145_t